MRRPQSRPYQRIRALPASLPRTTQRGPVTKHTTAKPLNEPRAALVEPQPDGAPRLVNRLAVEVIREEWRVVDRWWTEGWFSQRGA
jgi:hypothetical protein